MFQVLIRLAAVNDSVLRAVDLEQEEHVVLIDLASVVALHKVVDLARHRRKLIQLSRRGSIRPINSLLSLNLSIDPLLLHKVALEQTIVELNLRESLEVVVARLAELGEDATEELGHKVVMVHEDLEEVLNPHHLLRTQLQVFVLGAGEVVTVRRVVDHGLNDAERHI